MLFNGEYTHAILKKAKTGDFRVQDDFGGTVEIYTPKKEMIELAKLCIQQLNPTPVYARVDIIWDNNNNMSVSELELIEPELWFRFHKEAAKKFALGVKDLVKNLVISIN